jgi:very-long-chain enoyl-CoA reductase
MPWTNIIKNCSHYWGISGVAIGYFLYHPLYTPASWLVAQPELFYGLVGLMAVCSFFIVVSPLTIAFVAPLFSSLFMF